MSPSNEAGGHLRRPMSSTTGLDLLARTIWYRGKAKINRVLQYPSTSTTPTKPSLSLPCELVEMIIAHLIDDLQSLKACSLTCYSWYIAAVPHLHRTFVFTRVGTSNLKPLLNRHALGLLPFVKEMTILQKCYNYSWFLPRFFLHRDSRLFFAFTNVQILTVESLEIHKFIPGPNRYFGHLSPTLRSLTLNIPHGTPRHLSHFISLFPNLNDVKIRSLVHPGLGVSDDTLVPFSAPKFEGRLTLLSFAAEVDETWEQLAHWGGLRFRTIHLHPSLKCAPVLFTACAETVETLRIEPDMRFYQVPLIRICDLSRLKVLRSFQIEAPTSFHPPPPWQPSSSSSGHFSTPIELIFSTITSPAFSQLVLLLQSNRRGVYVLPGCFFGALSRMYTAKPFELEFLLVDSEPFSEPDAQQRWAECLNAAIDGGRFGFLGRPPSIRYTLPGESR